MCFISLRTWGSSSAVVRILGPLFVGAQQIFAAVLSRKPQTSNGKKTAHNRNVRICAKKSKHNDGRGTYARFALMKTLQGPNLGERG